MSSYIIRYAKWLSKIKLINYVRRICETLYDYTFYSYLLNRLTSQYDDTHKEEEKLKYDIAGGYIFQFFCLLTILLLLYEILPHFSLLIIVLTFLLSAYRLYDLLIVHASYTIFKEKDGIVTVRNAARYVFYTMLNFFEIIICLAVFKLFFEEISLIKFSFSNSASIWDSIYFIIVTLLTLGYGDIHPMDLGGKIFVIFVMSYFAIFFFFVFPIIASAIKVKVKDEK